jgi:hypothetical protein
MEADSEAVVEVAGESCFFARNRNGIGTGAWVEMGSIPVSQISYSHTQKEPITLTVDNQSGYILPIACEVIEWRHFEGMPKRVRPVGPFHFGGGTVFVEGCQVGRRVRLVDAGVLRNSGRDAIESGPRQNVDNSVRGTHQGLVE